MHSMETGRCACAELLAGGHKSWRVPALHSPGCWDSERPRRTLGLDPTCSWRICWSLLWQPVPYGFGGQESAYAPGPQRRSRMKIRGRLFLLRPDARRPGECRHQRCAGLVVALAAVHDSSTAKTETLLTAPNPAAALAKARAEFLNRIDRVVTVCERTAGIRVDNLARSWRGSTCKTRPSLRRRQGQYGGRLADADQFVMILEAVCKQ
jgi:hypothetical protein